MARIIAYPNATNVSGDDCLIGSQKLNCNAVNGYQGNNPTKNFAISDVVQAGIGGAPKAADNADAIAQGLSQGQIYITDGTGAAPLNAEGIVMVVMP